MKLSVLDRLLLLGLLPPEGDVTTLRIVRTLREDLSFSEQEHTHLNLKHEDGHVTWDAKPNSDKDVSIGSKGQALIVDALTRLSEAKKLTAQYLDLYDKFLPAE